jgi:tRNA A37 methylthiotransferase MiaB
LDLLITHKNKIGEITIPIQSGSDRILKLMKRPYTREETYNVLTQIRARMPDVKVGTQLMVGFPGETHKDFMETSRLIDD